MDVLAGGVVGAKRAAPGWGWAVAMLLRVRVNEAMPRLIRLVSHEEWRLAVTVTLPAGRLSRGRSGEDLAGARPGVGNPGSASRPRLRRFSGMPRIAVSVLRGLIGCLALQKLPPRGWLPSRAASAARVRGPAESRGSVPGLPVAPSATRGPAAPPVGRSAEGGGQCRGSAEEALGSAGLQGGAMIAADGSRARGERPFVRGSRGGGGRDSAFGVVR